jgi:hypothetical protein
MSKRTIPEGSEILPPIAKRVTPAIVIQDDSDDELRADNRHAMDEAMNPGMDHRRVPDWVYRPGLRYAQLQCRMRHQPGTCKHCAIVIE